MGSGRQLTDCVVELLLGWSHQVLGLIYNILNCIVDEGTRSELEERARDLMDGANWVGVFG
jgi:hypothetical protein